MLYKNDPVGLQRMRDQSLATFLDRFARGQTARSEKTMAGVTPQAKALFGDLKYATTDASEAAYLSPVKVISDAVRSLPTTGALLLTALLTRGASLKAEQSAIAAGMTAAEARTAATEAAVQMASKFGAASEGTIGYAQNALQTQSENEKIPFKKLEASPEYQELIAKGFDPAAARIYLASKSGEIAGVGGGVSDAVANAFGGKVLGKILSEGGGVLARMAKGFINEGAVEGIQSPLETWFQNAATKQLMDPSKDLSEGLLESTIQGFMVGGLTGSAFAGALGHSQQNEQAAESAARIAELFAAAANSLTGKRSPATLDAFIEHLAPGATVLIDPVKLNEVLSQSGVDLGVLPTAAAQMAEGEIGGSGIEIPVSELVTGLTGTGAEKSIVNHLRMAPDMPTLAEAQDFDSKAAEFFQTEADRILEQESKNADFTAAAQAVHDDLFTQLTAVGRHGPQVNTSYAKLGSAFYTTLANKLGVTPLQVRDGWTDSDGGVHRGYALKIGGDPSDAPQLSQGFSHGQAMLNIGLDVGATDRAQKIDAAFAKQEIEKLGVQVLSGAEVVGEYELDGAQVQEKTYVPHLSRPLTEAETTQLAEALGQEAIGHYYNGTGNLWGPNASAWGEFAPGFFKDQEGNSLLSYQERGLAQAMAAYRAPEKRNEKGDLLAPNGKPSNLDERQWHIVRSPQFKEWFGDWEAGDVWARGDVSKVVDANGEPLVVYHGTKTGGFTTFRPDKADEHRTPMIFTAATRDTASTYAGSHSDIALGQDPKTQADFEERGFSFDETEAGQYEVYDPNWRLIAEGVSLTQALQEAADEFKYNGNSYEHDNQRGVYPLFLNIRNPNEAYFEGANWDGTVYDKYEVRDLRNEDPIYGSNDSRFFATAADARAAAELAGIDESDYEVTPAQNLWETTNSVAEDAKRYGNDGAIIRETTDDGGHGGHADVDDIFVFFKPNQAKSATQNLGAFSTTDDNILHQSQSTRRPTTKRAPEDHLGGVPLTVDYTKIEPEKNAQNMALAAKYPGLRFKARDPAKRVEEFIQHATDNLLWLHDQIPADIRNRSKLWYDGARTITERWATKYNKTDAQIAAVLAVYSPQRDWFMNVSLAERTLDIVKNQQNTPWSPEMSKVSTTILSKEQFALLRAQIEGKTLSQLTDRFEQAAWLRVYDEAHNNRGHRLVTPEGGLGEFVRNGKDVDAKTGWPGFATIIKALYVIEDGSAATIDAALGAEHKVRSFYNNIFHPNSDQGFVTIDTHAVAAALLRPLSGDTLEVWHNFGRSGAAQSAATGMSGTYPYYQEAYRRAAEARGLLPREMQSIAWEAVRELYTMGFKHDKAKLTALDKIWSEYGKGKRSIDDVRDQVLKLAGGIERPAWIGRDSGLSEKGWASTYTSELLGRSAPGTDGRGTRRGNRGVAAQGTSEVLNQSAPLIRAGAVSAPVVGVHFSKQAREMLNSGYFGTGTKGAEAERLAQSNDPRIKQRIAFYIDEGSGVHPEPGVGGVAHVATLSNLYDADADTLKIFRRNQRDLNAAESAVLDAGFDGYLQRKNFTNQGTAVLLGSRGVDAEHVGGVEEANARATVPPPADIPAMKTLAIQLMNDRTLPGGALLPSEWKAALMKKDSPLVRLIDFDQFNPDERIYKDQLAGALWQTSETWYYSQLTRAIENASDKIFTTGKSAAQWLTANAGKLGVKKEELEFTGITDWLALQPKVTKADVVAFMQQGGVKVEEVMLGAKDQSIEDRYTKAFEAEKVAMWKMQSLTQDTARLDATNLPWWAFDEAIGDKHATAKIDRLGLSQEARQAVREYGIVRNELGEAIADREADKRAATKFASYVLPGGENYRELLITLPERDPRNLNDISQEMFGKRFSDLEDDDANAVTRAEQTQSRTSAPRTSTNPTSSPTSASTSAPMPKARGFCSSKRCRATGGQKGKKDGFGVERETKPVSEGEYSDFMTRMKDAAAEELVRRGAGQVTLDTARVIANSQPILAVAEWAGMTAEYADIQARQDEDYQIDQRGRGAVPSAPFVTDTKAWTGLAVKRILAYAAENGFDKVAWTTGEQQAERYDLSKQVSGISYRNAKNGEGYEVQVIGDKANTIWSSEHATASELEDVVGKEIAKKIADGAKAEWANLSGIDLKVGGEGMHAYYDQILPQVVRDVLKKVGGGQVETVTIATRSLAANRTSNDCRTCNSPALPSPPPCAKQSPKGCRCSSRGKKRRSLAASPRRRLTCVFWRTPTTAPSCMSWGTSS
ncbi:MAG: hypothetical protein IPM06_19200 [Rhizobiales bacterium]|nr:hypothetical protein [Hyphomicrobiales bacterium]